MPDDSFSDEPSATELPPASSAAETPSTAPPSPAVAETTHSTPPTSSPEVPVAILVPPSGPGAPTAPVAAIVSSGDPALEERLRRLEQVLQQQMKLIESQYAQQGTQPAVARPAAPATDGLWWNTLTFLGTTLGYLPTFLSGGPTNPNRPAWWMDTLAEMRAMQRMFVDPRYNLSWVGRLVPLVLVVLFVFPYYWVPGATFLGWLIERPAQLVVAYALIRTLQWEARRYRETAPDLPPSLRL